MSKPFSITLITIAALILLSAVIFYITFYPIKIEQVSPGGQYTVESYTPLNMESEYWGDYVKPEGWVTLANEEYGFSVDIPAEWETYSDPETSLIFNASDGMLVSSGQGIKIRFAILDNLKKMPRLKNNDNLIARGGNAFKYFRGVYSHDPDTKGDDLIVYYPVGVLTEDLTLDNFIRINENREGALTEADLTTIKTVIKSFRKL